MREGRTTSALLAAVMLIGVVISGCPNPVCGDGVVEGDEECDTGDSNLSDTAPNACRMDCTDPLCGDGVVDNLFLEECDDGNRDDGDGCSALCRIEFDCGDGVVTPGAEVCDDGAGNSDVEPNACRADCTEPACGDSVLDDQFGEECDDGNTDGGDGCDETCRFESGTLCGDVVDLSDPSITTSFFDRTEYSAATGTAEEFAATCGGGDGPETVHTYTAVAQGRLLVQTLPLGGGEIDSVVSVHTDCLDPAGSELGCDNDGGPGTLSRVVTDLHPADVTFFVVVDAVGSGSSGDYLLSVVSLDEGLGGDDCATTGSLPEGSYYDDSSLGTNAVADATCGGATAADLVYAVDSPGSVDLIVLAANVNGSYDIVLSARTSCGDVATEVECANDAGSDEYEMLEVLDAAATTYYVIVDGAGGEAGELALHAYFRQLLPSGSTCDDADPTARCETGTYCLGMPSTCQAPTVLSTETFDADIPATWTVVDYLSDGDTWVWCDGIGPCPGAGDVTNDTGSPSGGGFAIVDSQAAGTGATLMDELWLPAIDLSAFAVVELGFNTYYRHDPSSSAVIELSTDGGLNWSPIDAFTADVGPGALVRYDISSLAAGQSSVLVRFVYTSDWDWWWKIDDVTFSGGM